MTISTEKQESENQKRRNFVFSALGIALLSIFAGAASFLEKFFKTLFDGASQLDLGDLKQFQIGQVAEHRLGGEKFYVIRNLEGLYVLRAVDSQGSPIEWSQNQESFVAQSGRRYYKTGIPIEGQNKKSIHRFAVKRSTEGHVLVNTAKSFRQEKGDWSHPESFLKA